MNQTQRDNVVKEALTWLRTPWHHAACVKGAGVDCVHFLVGVYNNAGVTDINLKDIPYYPVDIMFHNGMETVLDVMNRYAVETKDPQPGDIAVWKFGRIFSHAALVIQWPQIIHAYRAEGGVVFGHGEEGLLQGREVKFLTLKDEI